MPRVENVVDQEDVPTGDVEHQPTPPACLGHHCEPSELLKRLKHFAVLADELVQRGQRPLALGQQPCRRCGEIARGGGGEVEALRARALAVVGEERVTREAEQVVDPVLLAPGGLSGILCGRP